jgi:hypothetical protein
MMQAQKIINLPGTMPNLAALSSHFSACTKKIEKWRARCGSYKTFIRAYVSAPR